MTNFAQPDGKDVEGFSCWICRKGHPKIKKWPDGTTAHWFCLRQFQSIENLMERNPWITDRGLIRDLLYRYESAVQNILDYDFIIVSTAANRDICACGFDSVEGLVSHVESTDRAGLGWTPYMAWCHRKPNRIRIERKVIMEEK